MVVLNRIYTKTGDAGETALGNGARVAKHSLRVQAYGTVDEANSTVGLARLHAEGDLDAQLARIQNDLFDLGADLCRPNMEKDADSEYPPLRMIEAQVTRLEREIDAMNARLEPLRSFILPGGSPLAAHLHLCRTVAAGPRRLTVELATMEEVNEAAVKYLNRLSDWFFVAARIANDEGRADVLWVPGRQPLSTAPFRFHLRIRPSRGMGIMFSMDPAIMARRMSAPPGRSVSARTVRNVAFPPPSASFLRCRRLCWTAK
jgi:cob(I)alamin adenosyltransferase